MRHTGSPQIASAYSRARQGRETCLSLSSKMSYSTAASGAIAGVGRTSLRRGGQRPSRLSADTRDRRGNHELTSRKRAGSMERKSKQQRLRRDHPMVPLYLLVV